MTVYWTDDDQQQERPSRSLLTWLRTWIRIRNKNQQQRRKDNA